MKSGDYQKGLAHNVGPSVRKLGLCQRSWCSSRIMTTTYLTKHPEMVGDKALENSEVVSNESGSKSHRTPMESSQNCCCTKAGLLKYLSMVTSCYIRNETDKKGERGWLHHVYAMTCTTFLCTSV